MTPEELLAKEIADLVKAELRAMGVRIDALAARCAGLEAANTVRASVDEIKARLDRIERASKAAVVRIPGRGSAAISRASRLPVVHSRFRTSALLEACGRNLDACRGPLNVLHQLEECHAYSVGKYQGIGPDSDEN